MPAIPKQKLRIPENPSYYIPTRKNSASRPLRTGGSGAICKKVPNNICKKVPNY